MGMKLLAGAGILALAAFLVVMFGNARERDGRLAERVAARDRDVARIEQLADQRVAGERRVTDAVAAFASRAAALKPLILTSHDTVTSYAQTPAGAALCLAADRVSGIDALDASLFPPAAAASAGAGTVHADPGAAPGGRLGDER